MRVRLLKLDENNKPGPYWRLASLPVQPTTNTYPVTSSQQLNELKTIIFLNFYSRIAIKYKKYSFYGAEIVENSN